MKRFFGPQILQIFSLVLWATACGVVFLCQMSFVEVAFPTQPELEGGETKRPTQSFHLEAPFKGSLEGSAFSLSRIDRQPMFPDLRQQVVFYGCNRRPDRPPSSQTLQFGLKGSKNVLSAPVGQKIFLRYERPGNHWTVSEQSMPLSISMTPTGAMVSVAVECTGEGGEPIDAPSDLQTFSLPATTAPIPPGGLGSWTIGELTADGTLLDRQGAMWWGEDVVVQSLGGEEMAYEASRQRIQFGTGETAYVLWAQEGDLFTFEENRWFPVQPGSESLDKPLLEVREIREKALRCRIWNPDGSRHILIDLPRKPGPTELQVPEVKLIGAKSKREWTAEIRGTKLTIAPDDWVVLSANGPVVVKTPEVLDQYLQGKLPGTLLAFSGIGKVGGEWCLVGTVYDCTRTRSEKVAVSLYRSWKKQSSHAQDGSSLDDEEEEVDESDEDLAEEDDEDIEDDDDDGEDE